MLVPVILVIIHPLFLLNYTLVIKGKWG
jgi:hypothetical protein